MGRSWFGGEVRPCLQDQVSSPVDHRVGDVPHARVELQGSSGWRQSLGAASRQATLAMDEGPETRKREGRNGARSKRWDHGRLEAPGEKGAEEGSGRRGKPGASRRGASPRGAWGPARLDSGPPGLTPGPPQANRDEWVSPAVACHSGMLRGLSSLGALPPFSRTCHCPPVPAMKIEDPVCLN